jgi:RNA polymerase sigma-70 factor, ECF subfamily
VHSLPEPSGALAIHVPSSAEAPTAVLYDREVLATIARNMRRLAGPHNDFDDLVQKALLAAHRSLPTFRGDCHLQTFLYSICYRVWLHHTRWRTRFLRRFTLTDEGSLPEQVDFRNPAELLAYRQRYAELYGALEKLPTPMRAVVVLHDLDELQIEEIADIVGANLHTVRSRLRHGRQKLRTILEKKALREGHK